MKYTSYLGAKKPYRALWLLAFQNTRAAPRSSAEMMTVSGSPTAALSLIVCFLLTAREERGRK